MKLDELTVDVTARLTVSDETADRCLRLLEMWQIDHPEQRLKATTEEDGSFRLYRETWEKVYADDPTTSY